MLHPPVTIPIAFVHGMLSGVRARGLPCDDFLTGAGIAPELLQQAGARVTADQYVALFRLLIARLDDDALGFLSRPFKRGSFALIARSALSAPTLEVAARRVVHTFRLLQDDLIVEPVRDGALAGLALRFMDGAPPRALPTPNFLHELLLRVFWRLLAWLAGGQLPAARFDFAFESPSYAGSYGKVFPAPLQFERLQSAFWFDASRLHAFLTDAEANIIVPRRGDDVISARVRSHLQRVKPEWPDLVATAEALHLSTATLQRRLAAEGTSFQSLKDELRRDMAIVCLNASSATITALAYDLGFADSAAFQRAFKSWTGSAPGSYRRGGI